MALFKNREMAKCLLLCPPGQHLVESDAPYGRIPGHLDFGATASKTAAPGNTSTTVHGTFAESITFSLKYSLSKCQFYLSSIYFEATCDLGNCWFLTQYAATILGMTPLELEAKHQETMKRIYGPRFLDGLAGNAGDDNDSDDSDDDGDQPPITKASKQADGFLKVLHQLCQ